MQDIIQAVEKHRQLIIDAERFIWQHPELGYKEVETLRYLAEYFEKLGYTLNYADGITGFTAELDTGKDGPTVMILGEMATFNVARIITKRRGTREKGFGGICAEI